MRAMSVQLATLTALVALALGGCGSPTPINSGNDSSSSITNDTNSGSSNDADGDGYPADVDCDDNNAAVHPDQEETCNGIDDNCNDQVDENFPDTDGDGIADCMDTETCDGVDNDGDGQVDEGFPDTNGDGTADCMETEVCDGVDNNGNGLVDEGYDVDGDGYTSCGDDTTPADCNDEDATINPGAAEIPGDGIDNNCNGLIDEGSWAAGDLVIDEIMNNPGMVPDPDGEWFEVYNNSARTLYLNGLVLESATDGDYHQVTSDNLLTVAPGEYFVFGSNSDVLTNGNVDVGYQYSDMSLSNETDDIIIEADGVMIDQVTWDNGATFPDVEGSTMNLDPDYTDANLNDDGSNWCPATITWDNGDNGSPGVENQHCWPIAVASYDAKASSLYTCSPLYLDGSGSSEPTGLSLTYSWELTSAPAGSSLTTSDIDTSTDMSPTFTPDVAGTYVFTLTVYNGTEYSKPSTVSVTITDRPYNTDPVADAGADQSYSEDYSCTPISYGASYDCGDCGDYDFDLDGSASADPDGDDITPLWAITGGTGSGSIDNDTSWTPIVTFTGPTATYGVDNTETVEVTLTVTDCMGATGSDSLTLSYTCTGTSS